MLFKVCRAESTGNIFQVQTLNNSKYLEVFSMAAQTTTDFSINAILGSCGMGQESRDIFIEKPKYTYSSMIVMAIQDSPQKKLTLNEIYEYIRRRFPYFERCSQNWQNSVRHTLSTNPIFVKVPRNYEDPGRGQYWSLNYTTQNFTIGDDTGKVRVQHTVNEGGYQTIYTEMYCPGQQRQHLYPNYQVQHVMMTQYHTGGHSALHY